MVSWSSTAAIIKNAWLYISFFYLKLNYFWGVTNATWEEHYYRDKYIYKGSHIVYVLQLYATSHLALLWPMWAHVTLPFCFEWFHRKQDKLELRACFLVFSWSIISRSFLLWLSRKSHTCGENPLFCWSISEKWHSESFQIALPRCAFSFQNRVCIESCCFTWRTATYENLEVWNDALILTTSEVQKTLSRDLGMLITWLLMTKAGRRVPMTFKRRLKGVLVPKKLLQKRTKHFL